MSNKSELEDLVKRCGAVTSRDGALLTKWELDPRITIARASRCRLARRNVEDKGRDIADVLARAESLSDAEVRRRPSQQRLDSVARLEGRVAQRETMDGPTLDDATFSIVLASAEQDASAAAAAAKDTFTECTT